MNMDRSEFTPTERQLLNDFQQNFPLTPRPYAELGRQLGISEEQVIKRLEELQKQGAISRIGPVYRPNRVGASTLAAMSVPAHELDAVAAIINKYPEVNHNYEREHEFNLWFVLTAPDATHLQQVIDSISFETGYQVMNLPMLEDYFIDLGFNIEWK